MFTLILALIDGTTSADFYWLYVGTVLIDLAIIEAR